VIRFAERCLRKRQSKCLESRSPPRASIAQAGRSRICFHVETNPTIALAFAKRDKNDWAWMRGA
jgi:hypothetical protein